MKDSLQLLCTALNRLFWKTMTGDVVDVNQCAAFWLAELADAPAGREITGLRWDRRSQGFRVKRTNGRPQ